MPVQIKLAMALCTLAVLALGCQKTPTFSLEQNAISQFGVLPGEIGVTVEAGSKSWHFVIRAGELNRVNTLPEAPKEAAAIEIGYNYGATDVPVQSGYDYRGPYLASPNNRMVAASVVLSASSPPGPWEFVIVETATRRILSKVGSNKDHYINGLAWSPDSSLVAALMASSRYGNGPIDQLGSMFGHPVPYMTYYIDVVDLNGKILASTLLASDVRASWGEIIWMK